MRMAGTGLANFLGDAPNFGLVGEAGLNGKRQERIAGHQAEAKVHGYGIKSIADIQAAEAMAEAEIAAGRAQGQASMMSGLFDGIGSLAGGASGKFGGGSKSPGIGTGPAFGEVGTTGSDMASLDIHLNKTNYSTVAK